jgi:uncharacterized alpha-E superfamily protein
MLGKNANGLFWMFRYLERSENIARMIEAGFRMGLTHATSDSERESVLSVAYAKEDYLQYYDEFDQDSVIDFLLRDKRNPSSVLSILELARNNARLVRTALTREVWESVNDTWLTLKKVLSQQVKRAELPSTLGAIRQQSANVLGALHGTMLRNDIFNFARIGTFIERADNTIRILDVKYYVLLPSVSLVGSTVDNAQWETILRSASAERAFRWLYGDATRPHEIVEFMLLDPTMPRSLVFCLEKLSSNLRFIEGAYNVERPSSKYVEATLAGLTSQDVDAIFTRGLHDFLQECLARNNELGQLIEDDYRFYR